MAYTHDFDISLSADGSKFLKGNLEFGAEAGLANEQMTGASQPLPTNFFIDALELIKQVEALAIKYGGLKTITFKTK